MTVETKVLQIKYEKLLALSQKIQIKIDFLQPFGLALLLLAVFSQSLRQGPTLHYNYRNILRLKARNIVFGG